MANRPNSSAQWETLTQAAHYNARELARLCGISVRQLQREFRRQFARSPQDWLNEQRLAAARNRLLNGDSVKKVALDLGFKQSSHFCRQFKLLNRLTPSEFVSLRTFEPESVAHGQSMSSSDNLQQLIGCGDHGR